MPGPGGAGREDYERRVATVRAAYVARAREEAAELCELAGRTDDEGRDRLRQLAHRVNGTAGTFGFAHVSAAAAQLEQAIDGSFPPDELRTLTDRLAALLAGLDENPVG